MKVRYLGWLIFVAAASLVACGGAEDPVSKEQQTDSSQASAAAKSQVSESVNASDAVVQKEGVQDLGASDEAFEIVDAESSAGTVPSKTIDLGAPTADELAQPGKNNKRGVGIPTSRAYQIGFARPVTSTSLNKSLQQELTWSTTSTGALRGSLQFSSTGARAVRLGLQVHKLPDEALLRVYAAGSAQARQTTGQHVNAMIRENIAADGDSAKARTYWMPSTEGESVVFEVDLPAGMTVEDVALAVPTLSHQVQTAVEAELGLLRPKTACAALNPDATCTLPPAVNAVTTMDFIVDGTPYVCTGTLVSNRGATQQGHVLTANHCISTQTVASTVISHWFYRSSACDSTTINPSYTWVMGGATLRYTKSDISGYVIRNGQLVVTSDGTDTTLLDLVGTPPVGTMFAGWAYQHHGILTGTSYVALHHPKGLRLRRSDGELKNYFIYVGNNQADIRPDNRYPMYEVGWSSGITESGSSGSALFHDGTTANPKIIGQLSGGYSSCELPSGRDYYGRFDLAYENGLIDWLNPGYRMVFRFYNATNGAHFFSASVGERDAVRANVPTLGYEAPVFMVAPAAGSGLSPVHRFFNRLNGVHFYTINEAEKNMVIANLSSVYTYEGVAWYARQASDPAPGTVEVYRFFQRFAGTHLYTTSTAERDNIINTLGQYYTYEGVAYLAWPLS